MPKDDKNTAIYVGFEECPPYDTATPERNLLRAILLTAMSDLKRQGESHREASEFFLSEDESYVFSFVSICNHLDVDPNQILLVTGLKGGASQQAPVDPAIAELLNLASLEAGKANGTN
ncbi:MAG: hypothetical protein J0M12_11100 [Deltaproteobacteria bacterium]|nr:hypothetical protein [Deltaproteobacteria bacterium]